MKQLFYSIEVRDKEGKLYKTSKGQKVKGFKFEEATNEEFIELTCIQTFLDYQAICKEGSQIDITVSCFNSFSMTYSVLYSFYGAENKFIKH